MNRRNLLLSNLNLNLSSLTKQKQQKPQIFRSNLTMIKTRNKLHLLSLILIWLQISLTLISHYYSSKIQITCLVKTFKLKVKLLFQPNKNNLLNQILKLIRCSHQLQLLLLQTQILFLHSKLTIFNHLFWWLQPKNQLDRLLRLPHR